LETMLASVTGAVTGAGKGTALTTDGEETVARAVAAGCTAALTVLVDALSGAARWLAVCAVVKAAGLTGWAVVMAGDAVAVLTVAALTIRALLLLAGFLFPVVVSTWCVVTGGVGRVDVLTALVAPAGEADPVEGEPSAPLSAVVLSDAGAGVPLGCVALPDDGAADPDPAEPASAAATPWPVATAAPRAAATDPARSQPMTGWVSDLRRCRPLVRGHRPLEVVAAIGNSFVHVTRAEGVTSPWRGESDLLGSIVKVRGRWLNQGNYYN
jgi:hypothetical protein